MFLTVKLEDVWAVALPEYALLYVWLRFTVPILALSSIVTLWILAPVTFKVVKSSKLSISKSFIAAEIVIEVTSVRVLVSPSKVTLFNLPEIATVVKSLETNDKFTASDSILACLRLSEAVSSGSSSLITLIVAVSKSVAPSIEIWTPPVIVKFSTPALTSIFPLNPDTLTVATFVKSNSPE